MTQFGSRCIHAEKYSKCEFAIFIYFERQKCSGMISPDNDCSWEIGSWRNWRERKSWKMWNQRKPWCESWGGKQHFKKANFVNLIWKFDRLVLANGLEKAKLQQQVNWSELFGQVSKTPIDKQQPVGVQIRGLSQRVDGVVNLLNLEIFGFVVWSPLLTITCYLNLWSRAMVSGEAALVSSREDGGRGTGQSRRRLFGRTPSKAPCA